VVASAAGLSPAVGNRACPPRHHADFTVYARFLATVDKLGSATSMSPAQWT